MDLEIINKVYARLANDLKKQNDYCNEIEKQVNDSKTNIEMWNNYKGYVEKCPEYSDEQRKSEKERANENIDLEKRRIKQLEKELLGEKAILEEIKGAIDAKIAEIKENPEMKKHLDTVLKKKYERKLAKEKTKRDELIEKKDKVEQIKQLTIEHPNLANNLKGMISAYKTIEKLKMEAENLQYYNSDREVYESSDQSRSDEINQKLIPEAEKKMSLNKELFMDYIKNNKLSIEEKDVNELVEKGIIDKNGKVDLENTFVKSTKRLDGQIRRLNKSIEDYTFALDAKGTIETAKPRREQQENRGQMNEEKPKWFQLIKRFRAWRDRRNQPELPEGGQETPSEEEKKTKSPVDEFADSLKYNVVKDIVEQTQEEELGEARKARIEKELQSKEEPGKDGPEGRE